MQNLTYLPMINLTPTMRCNLKCRLCGVLVPHYEYRPQATLAEFTDTLKAVFEIVDTVGKLQITGGEPLLHPNLADILEECFKYSAQFEKLWLFTNSTVLLKPQLVEVLRKNRDRLIVHVSDYGVRHDMTNELIKIFEGNGIEYKYLKYFGNEQYANGWVDQGDFQKHYRHETELEEVFSKCINIARGGSWYVRGGQMHWCGRSIRGAELGMIPVRSEDFLDIFDKHTTLLEKRVKLQKLLKTNYILACDYCNGYFCKGSVCERYSAGEQLP